jgi:hypothetical protein
MKTSTSAIIIIAALIVGAFLIIKLPPHKEAPGQIQGNVTNNIVGNNAPELCYIWNTEAGDSALIDMKVDGANVIGAFYFLPAEKDIKIGEFKGTISEANPATSVRTVNALWDTQAEGMTTTEELKINLKDSIANPGFGEMKDRGDGVYVYSHPDKIDYSLNLQQTDCATEGVD